MVREESDESEEEEGEDSEPSFPSFLFLILKFGVSDIQSEIYKNSSNLITFVICN